METAGSKLTNQEFALFLTILWNIWNRRNDWIHNKHLQPPLLTLENDKSLLNDYQNANICSSTRNSHRPTLQNQTWKKPGTVSIKINSDVAFDPITGSAVIGVVARNSDGVVLGGISLPLVGCPDAASAEAQAIIAGLRLAS